MTRLHFGFCLARFENECSQHGLTRDEIEILEVEATALCWESDINDRLYQIQTMWRLLNTFYLIGAKPK
jgi:hypothetical protein